jgi:hypothetical protein
VQRTGRRVSIGATCVGRRGLGGTYVKCPRSPIATVTFRRATDSVEAERAFVPPWRGEIVWRAIRPTMAESLKPRSATRMHRLAW